VNPFQSQKVKIKVTGPTTADTLNAPYLPNAKAYELQTWYTDGAYRFAKVTILIILFRAAFSY